MTARKYKFDPKIITVRKGRLVRLIIKAEDRDHGFKLEAFGIEQRLLKGALTTIEFTADKAGTFPFKCAVFCWPFLWAMLNELGQRWPWNPSLLGPKAGTLWKRPRVGPRRPMRLAEIAIEAGLPPGVLNVVNGDKEAVDTLLENKTVQAISFVGSTPIVFKPLTLKCFNRLPSLLPISMM